MSTIKVSCPCGCTEVVSADMSGGVSENGEFSSENATVDACAKLRENGIAGLSPVSYSIDKSSIDVSEEFSIDYYKHRDGLVWMKS